MRVGGRHRPGTNPGATRENPRCTALYVSEKTAISPAEAYSTSDTIRVSSASEPASILVMTEAR